MCNVPQISYKTSKYRDCRVLSKTKRLKYFEYMALQNGKCFSCGIEMESTNGEDNSATWEHVIPRSKRGKFNTMVLSCKLCNQKRGNRGPTKNEKKRAHHLFNEYVSLQKSKKELYGRFRRLKAAIDRNGVY